MSLENVKGSFVGQKISKLCWCPARDGGLSNTEFMMGSWDDKVNSISRWKMPSEESSEETEEGNNAEPYMISEVSQTGSITDLAFASYDKLVYSTSIGEVGVVSVDVLGEIRKVHKWEKLHQYKATGEYASCCCLAVNEHNVVTGGEDGTINLLHLEEKKPIHVVENADSANITGLQFLSSKEVASINTTGQLKVWDLQRMQDPVKTLTLSGNACPLLCLDAHPNQPHILVTGHGDGVIGIWDIRQDKAPVTLIDAHEAEVWQVRFHPMYPDNLFTCSQDGSCWFWNGSSMIAAANYVKSVNDTSSVSSLHMSTPTTETPSSSIWLYVDANKHKMETFSLIPFNKSAINTFDVSGSTLICGTDGESVITVNDIPVR